MNQKRFDSCTLLHKRLHFCLPRQERFFLLSGVKTGQNTEKTVVGAVSKAAPATVFAFSESKMQVTFWVSLLSKEFGKMMSGRI